MGLAFQYRVRWNFSCIIETRLVGPNNYRMLPTENSSKTSKREYNPIERFWQWLKAKIYGASAFDTIEAVIAKIRQLIWHYHEGWLTTSIHFDFAPYAQIL